MNGSQIKVVIDTNVLFMSIYDRNNKAGKIIDAAINNKIQLFSPDSVKTELERVLKRELSFSQEEIKETFEALPVTWVEKSIYEEKIKETKVKHKPDKPIEALSIVLGCDILSADAHFKNRLDINNLLKELEEL